MYGTRGGNVVYNFHNNVSSCSSERNHNCRQSLKTFAILKVWGGGGEDGLAAKEA